MNLSTAEQEEEQRQDAWTATKMTNTPHGESMTGDLVNILQAVNWINAKTGARCSSSHVAGCLLFTWYEKKTQNNKKNELVTRSS